MSAGLEIFFGVFGLLTIMIVVLAPFFRVNIVQNNSTIITEYLPKYSPRLPNYIESINLDSIISI